MTNSAFLNRMWGQKVSVAEGKAFLKEHPKARFYDRVTSKELKIVDNEFLSISKKTTKKTAKKVAKPKVAKPKVDNTTTTATAV